MKIFSFFVFVSSFLTFICAEGLVKSECLEREKALALLETAEEILLKARNAYPSCNASLNSTDQSECGEKKPLAYIEISRKLISDVRENFPNCTKINVRVDRVRDCSEISANGRNESGIYAIWPNETDAFGAPLLVYCDMNTDKGGWTVIQRRGKFPVQQDFYKDFETYKKGFGNIAQEFWLGNENIRLLCLKGCEIRFDLQAENGTKLFAVYKNFNLTRDNYTLHISNYTGNLGDGMKAHNNYAFSTKDQGYIQKAKERQGGWWYSDDTQCNLNGVYQPGKNTGNSVFWYKLSSFYNIGSVEIKVRPK